MVTTTLPPATRPAPSPRGQWRAVARLFRIELRRNAMLWLLPVAVGLFYYNGYREGMALPAMWNLRAMSLQNRVLLDFAVPVTAAAAWMGWREARRGIADQLQTTARSRWTRQLVVWAATTCWAMLGCLGCVAVVYVLTARQASGGGPLWWPAVVSVAGIPVLAAIGFAAGTLFPSRFTTPLVAVGVFFGLGFGTQAASGDHSYWQISPLIAGAPDVGADPGVATFYHYLPDLSIAQLMFLTGLVFAVLGVLGLPAGSGSRRLRWLAVALTVTGLAAAGTATGLAGTGRMDPHGMIVIPALHDAASDQPVQYTPVCGHTAIPVCLNPAYAAYLPVVTNTLRNVLSDVAGLPGAPARISQVAEVYQQGSGNGVATLDEPPNSGPAYGMILPDGLPGYQGTASAQFNSQLSLSVGLDIMVKVIAGPARATLDQAQQAVLSSALNGLWVQGPGGAGTASLSGPGTSAGPGGSARSGSPGSPLPAPGSPAAIAGRRFARLPAAVRHAWLAQHLAALRAGQITLAQLP